MIFDFVIKIVSFFILCNAWTTSNEEHAN